VELDLEVQLDKEQQLHIHHQDQVLLTSQEVQTQAAMLA